MTARGVANSLRRFLEESFGRFAGRVQETRPLDVDILENDTQYLVMFDAPGASKEDVQVRFVDGSVRVRIDRFRDFREGFEMRFPGRGLTLEGRTPLPDDVPVNAHKATAVLRNNGILEITIPKQRPAS